MFSGIPIPNFFLKKKRKIFKFPRPFLPFFPAFFSLTKQSLKNLQKGGKKSYIGEPKEIKQNQLQQQFKSASGILFSSTFLHFPVDQTKQGKKTENKRKIEHLQW